MTSLSCNAVIQKDDNPPYNAACFASLFQPYSAIPPATKTVTNYVRLDTRHVTPQEASFFYKNYFLPNVPDALRGTFRIQSLCQARYNLFGEFARDKLLRDILKLAGRTTDVILPWKRITVDVTKINATDLYVLLTLSRYPQEFPQLVSKLAQYPISGDSFVQIHLPHILYGIYDHGLIGRESYRPGIRPEGGYNFNIKERWETMHNILVNANTPPYSQHRAKAVDISGRYFNV